VIRRKLPQLPPRRDRSDEFASWTLPKLHRGVYAPAELKAAPKDPEPVRDEDYRRLVAALPCSFCKIEGASQAAHGNRGKGLGLKTCDLTTFPACHEGAKGCHAKFDRYGFGPADEQAAIAQTMAGRTRLALIVRAQDDPHARKVLLRVGILRPQEATA
jgi:hypothetical protein